MKTTSLSVLCVALITLLATASVTVAAHTESRRLLWDSLNDEGQLLSGEIQPAYREIERSLRLSNTTEQEMTFPIVVLDHFYPTMPNFAVDGRVRYENVEGDAYLEMWTVLPDGQRFFTRTVMNDGPLTKITGTSDWRAFALPFNLIEHTPEYVTVEINLVLPGPGTVDLEPFRIVNLSPANGMGTGYAPYNLWWTNQQGGWIGGSLGGFLALLSVSLGHFASRNPSHKLVMPILALASAYGVGCLIGFVAAIYDSQPEFVVTPLGIIGLLGTTLPILMYMRIKRRVRDAEFRKMQALDAQ